MKDKQHIEITKVRTSDLKLDLENLRGTRILISMSLRK